MPKKTDPEMDRMADEIFDLIKVASAARARSRTGSPEELTEAEFLALDALVQRGPLSVGDIQKRIGVLPAQMSRIIRSLESKGGDAFVTCGINPKDRRKIDVTIAPKGVTAHTSYRALRLRFSMEILRSLNKDDREQFMRILTQIREGITARLGAS